VRPALHFGVPVRTLAFDAPEIRQDPLPPIRNQRAHILVEPNLSPRPLKGEEMPYGSGHFRG